jgi:hypothetical protein
LFYVADGRVFVPMVIKAVPVNLSPLYDSLNESSPTEPIIRYNIKSK